MIKHKKIKVECAPTNSSGYTDFPYAAVTSVNIDFDYTKILSISVSHAIPSSNGGMCIIQPYYEWSSNNYIADTLKAGARTNPTAWKIIGNTNKTYYIYFDIFYI